MLLIDFPLVIIGYALGFWAKLCHPMCTSILFWKLVWGCYWVWMVMNVWLLYQVNLDAPNELGVICPTRPYHIAGIYTATLSHHTEMTDWPWSHLLIRIAIHMYVETTVYMNWYTKLIRNHLLLATFEWNKKTSVWGKMGRGGGRCNVRAEFLGPPAQRIKCWRYTELQWKCIK